MRKPPPKLLERVREELGRDRWLFLDGRTAALDAIEAAAERKKPAR
jgi:hypothetical protein